MFVNSSESCGYTQTSCSVTLNMTGGAGISSAGGGADNINQSCGTPAPEDTTKSQVVVPDEVYMPAVPDECSLTHALPTNIPQAVIMVHLSRLLHRFSSAKDLIANYQGYCPERPGCTV